MSWHYLKPNRRTEISGGALALAVTTEPYHAGQGGERWYDRLASWAAVSWRLERGRQTRRVAASGLTTESLWSWVATRLDRCRPTWIWSYHAPRVLTAARWWQEWDRGEYSLVEPESRLAARRERSPRSRRRAGFIADGERVTICHSWHRSGAQVVALDVLNWYRHDLPELAARFGLPLGAAPPPGADPAAHLDYAREQLAVVEAVGLAVPRLVQTHDMGCLKYTLAGQSLQGYRHRFMRHKILCHDDDAAKRLERDGYWGGRVEPFYIGRVDPWEYDPDTRGTRRRHRGDHRLRGDVIHLDVANLYPWVMAVNLFPWRLQAYRPAGLPEREWDEDTLSRSIARVRLDSPSRAWPVRVGQETLYCRGRILTTLAGPELLAAYQGGELAGVDVCATYATADLFSAYVRYWWDERVRPRPAHEAPEAALGKSFLTSFYGVWGKRSARWQTVKDTPPRQPWGTYIDRDPSGDGYRVCRAIGGVLQVRQPAGEAPGNSPAVCAFVTAFGRVHMDRLRALAGVGQVYYQGVDALYVTPVGLNRLRVAGQVAPNDLGKLRVKAEAAGIEIHGCHDLTHGNTVIRGGVCRDRAQAPDGTVTQERYDGLASILATTPPPGSPHHQETVTGRDPYRRGVIGPGGWTIPYTREDW